MKKNKEFELFQSEFKRYQNLFGLSGYEARFTLKPLGDGASQIDINQEEMVAFVSLHNRLHKDEKTDTEIKKNAKHEALHLLTGRLRRYAYARHVTSDDIYEASEELVRRLDILIPDLPEDKEKQ